VVFILIIKFIIPGLRVGPGSCGIGPICFLAGVKGTETRFLVLYN